MRIQDHVGLTDEIVAQAVGYVVSLLVCDIWVQLYEQLLLGNHVFELVLVSLKFPNILEILTFIE